MTQLNPINPTTPYQVTTPEGVVKFMVMDQQEDLPSTIVLMAANAPEKTFLRITGGCKGMENSDKEEMISFFQDGLQGFQGTICSGSTRTVNEGILDPMVTDVPGIIAFHNPGCIAIGTAPRTDIMTLQDQSRLVLDNYGTAPNPSMSAVLMVQKGADGSLDWDGDLPIYESMMQKMENISGYRVGIISWNGGAVTEKEIKMSIKNNWPTILIKGSGRVTDELINKIESNDVALLEEFPNLACVMIVSKNKPSDLHSLMVLENLIKD